MDWSTWRLVIEGYKRAGSPYGRATDPTAVLRWWHDQLVAALGDAHHDVERELLARPLWNAHQHLN